MKPRRETVPNNSSVHVYFRCNNKQHLLAPHELKQKLIELMAKYKSRYGVKIFDFCIMDNHVHLYMWTPTSDALGNFMRTVLSREAYFVNLVHSRDSQAFRSRYRSPVVCSQRYGLRLIKYIYGNRIKTGGLTPDADQFCSAHWRLHKPYTFIENAQTDEELLNNQLATLIDDYTDESILKFSKREDFLIRMIAAAIRDSQDGKDYGLFANNYLIGSRSDREAAKKQLKQNREAREPPS